MLRIRELLLEGFLPVLTGTGKEKIHLIFENEFRIYVFIGKIGSGKTYILSHLQPFSTVGTLDIRNSDDHIIPERDGLKKIVYDKDEDEYVVIHIYTWNGSSHSKKSFIKKNGVELNPNGNRTSFEELVRVELGIDPSFLRLLRLGPNVVNFINMKSTERKGFIASLLKETEVYLLLHKFWSQELRTLNTSISILMNKLNSYGKETTDEVEKLLEDQIEIVEDLQEKKKDANERKYKREGEIQTLLRNQSLENFHKNLTYMKQDKECLEDEMRKIEVTLKVFEEYPDLTEVSREIGKYNGLLEASKERIKRLEEEYRTVMNSLLQKKEQQKIANNNAYIETLQETEKELLQKIASYKDVVTNFKCSYTHEFFESMLDTLPGINEQMYALSQYDPDVLKKIYHSDRSIVRYAEKQIEILGYRKLKLQKMINNAHYSESYEAVGKLYFPPFCPTKTCPYYQTHPSTIQKKLGKKSEANGEIQSYQNEIQGIDIEIQKYSEYSIIYSKLIALQNLLKSVTPALKEIHALRQSNVLLNLTVQKHLAWYDYDRIVDVIDILKKKEQYGKLLQQMEQVRNELLELKLYEDQSEEDRIMQLKKDKTRLESELDLTEKEKAQNEQKVKEYNEIYVALSEQSMILTKKEEIEKKQKEYEDAIQRDSSILKNVAESKAVIQTLDQSLLELNTELNTHLKKVEELRGRLRDMRYTHTELDRVLQEQKWMKHMVQAVSSKEGIPLQMIELFLSPIREIVNEMLYTVCDEETELLPFSIDQSEFKIPYMVNGHIVDDISKSSQGQSSLVSTAMSFALVKQTGMMYYNIPLLDEMDAPLHKKDKQKFIVMLLKYLDEIASDQCFMITHDPNIFEGYPVQVIMTTDESINEDRYQNAIHV